MNQKFNEMFRKSFQTTNNIPSSGHLTGRFGNQVLKAINYGRNWEKIRQSIRILLLNHVQMFPKENNKSVSPEILQQNMGKSVGWRWCTPQRNFLTIQLRIRLQIWRPWLWVWYRSLYPASSLKLPLSFSQTKQLLNPHSQRRSHGEEQNVW